MEDGVISNWFATPVFADEAKALDLTIGASASQQATEALAALLALRTWHSRWKEQGVYLRIKSDSISALIMVLRLKTSGRATSVIAREIALDIAQACYSPAIVEHVPGLANAICDALSRRCQPGKQFSLHQALTEVPESILPARGIAYFRTLACPPVTHVATAGADSASAKSERACQPSAV